MAAFGTGSTGGLLNNIENDISSFFNNLTNVGNSAVNQGLGYSPLGSMSVSSLVVIGAIILGVYFLARE